MKHSIKPILLAGLASLVVAAKAEIPGLYVIQENRIDDPHVGFASDRSNFGGGGIAVVGDLDSDGIKDIVAGSPMSNDSGSMVFVKLQKTGALKGTPFILSSRDPLLAPKMQWYGNGSDQWATGLAVAKEFEGPGTCGIVVTNSQTARKIWAVKLCLGTAAGSDPEVSLVNVIDSSSSALSGLQLRGYEIGSFITVLEKPSANKVVLALGNPWDGSAATSREGRVLILELDLSTLAFERKAVYPESYSTTDTLGKYLTLKENFGSAIVPLKGMSGGKSMAVLSRGFQASGTTVGKIRIINFGNDYKFKSAIELARINDFAVSNAPITLGAEDFDHDGISDLVIGYHLDNGGGATPVTGRGAFQIALLAPQGGFKSNSMFRPGIGGFQDIESKLGANARFGAKILATDIDRDGQMDVIVGSGGNAGGSTPEIKGAIWPLRMKSAFWKKSDLGPIDLTSSTATFMLDDYFGGNRLGWSLAEKAIPPTGLASCLLEPVAGRTRLACSPGGTNGEATWRLIATDSGNTPSTLHLSDTIDFLVRVKDQDSAPQRKADLPRVRISEDQTDTAALVFSKYFRDPEGKPMTVKLTDLNGSSTGLFTTLALSQNTDTLHLAGKPSKYGICSLKVEIKDQASAAIFDTLVIEVFHVNHAPVAIDYMQIIPEGKPATFIVLRADSDLDGDALKVRISIPPAKGQAMVDADGAILYQPRPFELAADSLLYEIMDATDTARAWVRIHLSTSDEKPIVYKPMRDTTVPERSVAEPIVIKVDSLFFWGPKRFDIEFYNPKSDCQGAGAKQILATVEYSIPTKSLIITPQPNKWGRCQIQMRAYLADSIANAMTLVVDSVPTPYRFATDVDSIKLDLGKPDSVMLDMVDLDGDSLEYASLKTLPSWIKLERSQLVFSPDANSDEMKLQLHTWKRHAAGANPVYTDTLSLFVYLNTASSVRGRALGSSRFFLSNQSARLSVVGGSSRFQIQILGLDGRILADRSGGSHETVSLDLSRLSNFLLLRLIEDGRISTVPLLVHH